MEPGDLTEHFYTEQAWDDAPPAGRPGIPTFPATPLGWAHGQYVWLAWSIAERRSLSTPPVMAGRYLRGR
ncbi:hypothetical protein GCM10029978_006810 [Actinoallomurus acanthiterrae]